MKSILFGMGLLLSSTSFAASTLFCLAEDGSQITAIEDSESPGSLFDIKISKRGSPLKSYPQARAAVLDDDKGQVTFLVITDPKKGIVAVVKDSSFYDSTGAYEIEVCEVGM